MRCQKARAVRSAPARGCVDPSRGPPGVRGPMACRSGAKTWQTMEALHIRSAYPRVPVSLTLLTARSGTHSTSARKQKQPDAYGIDRAAAGRLDLRRRIVSSRSVAPSEVLCAHISEVGWLRSGNGHFRLVL